MSLASARSPPPPALFPSTDALRELITPRNIGYSGPPSRPIPTNDWWGNLLAWDAHAGRDSDPIFANPYVYQVAHDKRGLSVAYLHDYRSDGPINENGAIKYYFYPATIKNLVFTAAEWTAASTSGVQLEIESWDDLGCTLQLSGASGHRPAATSPSQLMRGYLSMGNAFTTLHYHGNLHATVQSEHSILTVNGRQYEEGGVVETDAAASLEIVLNNGHKWILFYYPDASVAMAGATTRVTMQHNALTTTQPFNGVLQTAYVSSQASRQQDPDEERKVLMLYRNVAGVFPSGATLFTEESGDAFGFDWTLQHASAPAVRLATCAADSFVHFALSHLQVMMDAAYVIRKPELQLWSHTRGPMQAYTLRGNSSKWRFVPPKATSDAVDAQATEMVPVGTHIPGHIVQKLRLAEVVTQEILHTDWNRDLPHEGSYYFKGKALQKFATMVLVAKHLSKTTNPELQSVFEQGLTKLRDLLKAFAKNQAAYPLVYDTLYKGIISSEALRKKDINVDFGNAVYNDHHYHYGYYITAAAMLLQMDGETATGNHRPEDYAELRVFVETLIRDVVTTDVNDAFFPRFRLFNWFLGHSYSHGVTPMADGKDEESTSEEVNFLYGLALYGRVTQHKPIENLAKLMLKVNALAIETYFLIADDRIGTIHPASFGKNKVTGICFDNKCDYATWFNPARECIHGIQMIPVSPMLDVVRQPTFIREEWDQILAKLDCVKNWQAHGTGWTSLLYSNAAVLMPEQATEVLAKCPMDDGLSRAWALFMAASKMHN